VEQVVKDHFGIISVYILLVVLAIVFVRPEHEEEHIAEAYACGAVAGAESINKIRGIYTNYEVVDKTCLRFQAIAAKYGFTP
jgi:hypothetical protein